MWNFKYKDDYLQQVSDLMDSTAVQAMRLLPQHVKSVSCYHHCVLVSYSSYRICAALGLDARSAARGGLLHDLFLYNWMDPHSHPGVNHALDHPAVALNNARARFPITDKEADIIATHMFPCTITKFYGCVESFIVSTMDKLAAMAELLHLVPLITPEEIPAAQLCLAKHREERLAS